MCNIHNGAKMEKYVRLIKGAADREAAFLAEAFRYEIRFTCR